MYGTRSGWEKAAQRKLTTLLMNPRSALKRGTKKVRGKFVEGVKSEVAKSRFMTAEPQDAQGQERSRDRQSS